MGQFNQKDRNRYIQFADRMFKPPEKPAQQLFCVEYIAKLPNGSTRLIILDDLPEGLMVQIDAINEIGFDRMPEIERLYPLYGFAKEDNYNDGDMWKDHQPGVYVRVVDKAEDLHEQEG